MHLIFDCLFSFDIKCGQIFGTLPSVSLLFSRAEVSISLLMFPAHVFTYPTARISRELSITRLDYPAHRNSICPSQPPRLTNPCFAPRVRRDQITPYESLLPRQTCFPRTHCYGQTRELGWGDVRLAERQELAHWLRLTWRRDNPVYIMYSFQNQMSLVS